MGFVREGNKELDHSIGLVDKLTQGIGELTEAQNLAAKSMDSFGRSIDRAYSGNTSFKYFKKEEDALNDIIKSYEKYSRTIEIVNGKTYYDEKAAKNLIETVNAYKALSNINMDGFNFDKVLSQIPNIASELNKLSNISIGQNMSTEALEAAFFDLKQIADSGRDVQGIMKALSDTAQNLDLKQAYEQALSSIDSYKSRVKGLQEYISELQSQLDNSDYGRLKEEFSDLTRQMANEFETFLAAFNLDRTNMDWGDPLGDRIEELLRQIQNGEKTATEAITAIKSEFNSLFEGQSLDIQGFLNIPQIKDALNQLELLGTKIDEVYTQIQNGVKVAEGSSVMLDSSALQSFSADVQVANKLSEIIQQIIASVGEANTELSATQKGVISVLTSLSNLAGQDFKNLESLQFALQAITRLDGKGISASSLKQLENTIKALDDIRNLEGLTGISNLDFTKFNEIKVSKASVNNLVYFLQELSKINVDTIKDITTLDFDKLNGLTIKGSGLKALQEITGTITGNTPEENAKALEKEGAEAVITNGKLGTLKTTKQEVTEAEKQLKAATNKTSEAFEKEGTKAEELSEKLEKLALAKEHAIKGESILSDDTVTKDSTNNGDPANINQLDRNINNACQDAEELWKTISRIHSEGKNGSYKDTTLFQNIDTRQYREITTGVDAKGRSINEVKDIAKDEELVKELLNHYQQYWDLIVRLDKDQSKLNQEEIRSLQEEINYHETLYQSLEREAQLRSTNHQGTDNYQYTGVFSDLQTRMGEISTQASTKMSANTAVAELNKAYDEYEKAILRVIKAQEELFKTEQNSSTWYTKFDELSTASQAATGALAQLNTTMATYGNVADKDDKLTEEFSNEIDRVSSKLKDVLNKSVQSVQQYLEKNDITGAFATQMQSLISNSFNGVSVQNPGLFRQYSSDINTIRSEAEQLVQALKNEEKAFKDLKKAEADESKARSSSSKNANEYEKLVDILNKAKVSYDNAQQATNNLATSTEKANTIDSHRQSIINDNVKSTNNAEVAEEKYADAVKNAEAYLENLATAQNQVTQSTQRSLTSYIAMVAGFRQVVNAIKSGIDSLKTFDSTLTNISYTMSISKNELNDLGNSVKAMANEMGSSLENVSKIAQIYANETTNASEIIKSATPTLVLSNLTGVDASTAADQIQSVMQQFEMTADQTEHIVDVYDYISKNIAVDYSKGIKGMAEAVQVAGSTAKQAGLSFEELSAITAKTMEMTRQEGSQVGNGLKTIMTRLSKVGKLSDEIDNETLSKASASLKQIGIDVYESNGDYRKFNVIMGELAEQWDNLSDAQKANISFNIAATRQTNLLSAILKNYTKSENLATDATTASGNAMENQGKYLESYAGKMQKLSTAAETFWVDLLDSESTKKIIENITNILTILDKLVEKTGSIPTLATMLGFGALTSMGRTQGTFNAGTLLNGSNYIKMYTDQYSDAQKKFGISFNSSLFNENFIKSNNNMDSSLKAYLATLDKGQASLGGYASSLVGATGKAVAFTAASIALNAAVSAGISLLITWGAKAFDAMYTTVEEQKEKVEELENKYSELNASVKELRELELKGTITDADRSRLEYLEKRLDLDKQILEIEKSQIANKRYDSSFLGNFDKENIYATVQNDRIKHLVQKPLFVLENNIKSFKSQQEETDRLEDKYEETTRKFDKKNIYKKLEKQREKEKKALASVEKSYEAVMSKLEEYYSYKDQIESDLKDDSLGYSEKKTAQETLTLVNKNIKELEKYKERTEDVVKGTGSVINKIASVTANTSEEQIDEAISVMEVLRTQVEKTSTSLSLLSTALSEQTSTGTLSTETLASLTEQYDNIGDALEVTSQGVRLNESEFKKLIKSEQQILKIQLDKQQKDLSKEYQENDIRLVALNKQLNENINLTDKDKELIQQEIKRREELQTSYETEIGDLKLLQSEYVNTLSKYNAFIKGMEAPDMGTEYDTIVSKIKDIKEIVSKGGWGDEGVRAFVDMFTYEDLSTAPIEDIKAAYEEALKSAEKFYTEDAKGSKNFLELLEQTKIKVNGVETSLASKDEAGNWTFKINDMDEAAKALGMSVDFLQTNIDKLDWYGFDIDFTDNSDDLVLLSDRLSTIKKRISEIELISQKTGGHLSNSLKEELDSLQEEERSINIKLEPIISLSDAERKIKEYQEIINRYENSLGQSSMSAEYIESLKKEQKKLAEENGIDLKSYLDNEEPQSALDKFREEEESNPLDIGVDIGLENATAQLDQFYDEHKSMDIELNIKSGKAQKILSLLGKAASTVKANSDSESGTSKVDGQNNAYANGKSLVGELGQELLVRDGHYQTIGNNGAELIDVKPSDIIFDAEQTKQLLKRGVTGRGRAYADGTLGKAYAEGDAGYNIATNGTGTLDVNVKVNGSESNKKAAKEAADAWVQAFEDAKKELDDLKDEGKISEYQYLQYLRALYERFYGDLNKYSKEYAAAQKEYLNGKISLPFIVVIQYIKSNYIG